MDKSSEVEALIDKASKASKSEDAIRFSQAACNSANALVALAHWRKLSTEGK
jgi:hypothetical protein